MIWTISSACNIISMGIIWFAYFITDLMKLNQISIGSPRSWETCFLPNPVASRDKAKRGGTPSVSACHLPFVLPCHCGCKATSLMCCVMRSKEAAQRLCQRSRPQTSGREDSKGRANSGRSSLLERIGECAVPPLFSNLTAPGLHQSGG